MVTHLLEVTDRHGLRYMVPPAENGGSPRSLVLVGFLVFMFLGRGIGRIGRGVELLAERG